MPIIVTHSEEEGLSHTSQEIYDLVSTGHMVYFNSVKITGDSLFILVRSAPTNAYFTGPVDDGDEIWRVEIYYDQIHYYHDELVDLASLNEHVPTQRLEILPGEEHCYGVNVFIEDPLVVENGQSIETLTFDGVGGDELVRLRHLAPGSQDHDAVTVG